VNVANKGGTAKALKGAVVMQMRNRLQIYTPQFILAPSVIALAVCLYGFVAYTFYLSLTNSRILPSNEFVGLANYAKLWGLQSWWGVVGNWALFTLCYIALGTLIGLFLAVLLDQRLRGLAVFRPIFIYPMALSFIVSGTVWKWLLDPAIGIEDTIHMWGWERFAFHWIKDRDYAIFGVVLAALWQSVGLVMAIFLAALHRVDNQLIQAAQIDGASTTTIYRRIAIPTLWPVVVGVVVVLGNFSIKTYDLIIALTAGGPGRATEFPSSFMYAYTYGRNEMGLGASSAIMMVLASVVLLLPMIYLKRKERVR
jgi:glucose/mannose transport system permease protein